MGKILEIFKYDARNLLKSKIAMIILAGIVFIPGIYAWLNIDSNWNPYGNTGNLPIAVVNKDDGVEILGSEVNIGNEIEKSLKTNDGMKWTFVNEDSAKAGVEKGEYYGSIIIPDNFSEQLTTILEDGKTVKPTFDFYANDKKNPIAPIIVNKAVGTVQASVNQAFVNKIIYTFAEKAESINIANIKDSSTADIASKLNEAKTRIQNLRLVIQTTGLTAETAGKSLSAIRALLPNISDISSATKQEIMEMKNVVQAFKSSAQKIEQDAASIINDSRNIIDEVVDIASGTNISNITTNLKDMSEKLNTILTAQKRLDDTLKSLIEVLPSENLQKLEDKVAKQISKIEELIQLCNNPLATTIDIENIKNKAASIRDGLEDAKNIYYDSAKAELNDIYSTMTASISDTTDSLLNANISLDNVDSGLGYTIDALVSGKQLTDNIDVLLANFQIDIDKVIGTIQSAKGGELYSAAIKLLKNKPEEIADFITSPIDVNQINLYEIEAYGSKMAPFYSILACWVGCTILTAILKVNVEESEATRGAKNYQKFFGRYILFGLLAMMQGLVIGLGDIVLNVQTANPLLFLITLMLASLIFVLIIYALAFSMGKVGQALAIVIMVLQVAGSGGTFPIELLPRPFQVLQPFMPFYPAMNAARETIGGFYDADYLKYIFMLLCHSVIPILLGLVFTKFTAELKPKFEGELEETGVIG